MPPKVVIVGRPNVGKSSLLNLLAQRRVSIVDPTAGVTRDRIAAAAVIPPASRGRPEHPIQVIDTGGYGIEDSASLTAEVERQIAHGLAEADLVLFVVDAQAGIVPLDEQVAALLRKSNVRTPVLLVANKVDSSRFESHAAEAAALGFGEPIMLSASNGYNKEALYEAIRQAIDWDRLAAAPDAAAGEGEPPEMLLAIVGKRNAGKSSLVNALAGQQRVIVSEVEGTTRDAIDVHFQINGRRFTAIDTAGVRKGKSLADDIEYYSHHRALRSIRRADAVLFLIDSTVPVSQVDKQLGNEILKHFKPCVLVVNKWDLAQGKSSEDAYLEYLDKAMKGFDFAPIVFTSALKDEGVRDAVAMALNLHEQAGHRVPTAELNRVMEEILAERGPSAKGGKRPKIYYATQLDVHPPTIGLFVNNVAAFDHGYQRYLINRFRELLPFSEVPIKLLIRGKQRMPASERIEQRNRS